MNDSKTTKHTSNATPTIDLKVLERQRQHARRALLKRRRKKSGQ